MEVVFFSFELGRGVHFGGADFLYGHLHIVHPLHHLAVPGVVHLPDEGVVLLPERHVEGLSASEALTSLTFRHLRLSLCWIKNGKNNSNNFTLYELYYLYRIE